MLDRTIISQQLSGVLKETHFDFLGELYAGKVRDCYLLPSGQRVLITSDRLSAFDKILTTIPFKGEVLTRLATYWFERTKHIVPNHIIALPDPNVMVVRDCKVFPIEVVVRRYLAGSAWRDYEAGRDISGHKLAAGMRPAQRFDQPLMTPSTKAALGTHDEPISEAQIVDQKIVSAQWWSKIREKALALFAEGERLAQQRGLLLVDTKYEFGYIGDELILCDEIHTIDSSRFWEADTYQELFDKGQPQRMLDKEPIRQWLLSQGYMGDGPAPTISDDKRIEIAQHYIHSFERVTGESFVGVVGDVAARIEGNMRTFVDRLSAR